MSQKYKDQIDRAFGNLAAHNIETLVAMDPEIHPASEMVVEDLARAIGGAAVKYEQNNAAVIGASRRPGVASLLAILEDGNLARFGDGSSRTNAAVIDVSGRQRVATIESPLGQVTYAVVLNPHAS